jgi:hypothetical protein
VSSGFLVVDVEQDILQGCVSPYHLYIYVFLLVEDEGGGEGEAEQDLPSRSSLSSTPEATAWRFGKSGMHFQNEQVITADE